MLTYIQKRTTEAYLYSKLTNEPKGSGELNIDRTSEVDVAPAKNDKLRKWKSDKN